MKSFVETLSNEEIALKLVEAWSKKGSWDTNNFHCYLENYEQAIDYLNKLENSDTE